MIGSLPYHCALQFPMPVKHLINSLQWYLDDLKYDEAMIIRMGHHKHVVDFYTNLDFDCNYLYFQYAGILIERTHSSTVSPMWYIHKFDGHTFGSKSAFFIGDYPELRTLLNNFFLNLEDHYGNPISTLSHGLWDYLQ